MLCPLQTAVLCQFRKCPSFDEKVCAAKQRCRKFKIERFCGLEVEGQLVMGDLVYGMSPGLVPLRICPIWCPADRPTSKKSGE
jgi:hypothetical protein